jgi:serine/threonine-protein kinase
MVAELRADLNIALKVGGPGRYTDRELGDYRLGMLIGRGGMGEVYYAEHIETGQEAAVKLLHRELLGAPKQLSRFLREVDTSRGFESEHVVRILAASGPEDPVPFLVMERLEGETLNARLRRDQTLDLSAVVELTRQVARALDEARERGIVHRDIKPQNLFCVSRGGSPVWKVLDFGVASLTDHTGTLTQGAVVGTPAYMSPEQAQGLSVDARADVYGLTAVIYRCLTGRPPFSSHDMPSLLYKVVHDSAPPVSTLAAVPAALDVVIERGLAKQPAKRFDTAGQLALAIDQAAGR